MAWWPTTADRGGSTSLPLGVCKIGIQREGPKSKGAEMLAIGPYMYNTRMPENNLETETSVKK